MKKTLTGIGLVLLPFLAGAIGSLATAPNIQSWYVYLNKPIFTPPSWLFGPAWTTLYLLMGISLYLIWKSKGDKKQAYKVFAAQLILNALWSLVFFGMHQLWLGFAVIVAMWLLIIWTIILFTKINKAAAWLLVPYILWVTFASALNLSVALLN